MSIPENAATATATATATAAVTASSEITIDIRPLLEDVSQLMTKHISKMLEGVVGDYAVYKETHDIIMSLPCVQKLQHKVSTLESALNYPDSAAHQCPPHPSVPQTSDYDEVSKLKSSIDKLTEYIRHLESRVRLPSISEESGKVGGGESEETVRLEVHEAHDTDSVDTASLAASDDETTTAVENEIVSRANEAAEEDAEDAESEAEDAEDAEAEDAESEAEDAEAEDAEAEAEAEEETEAEDAEEAAEEAEAEEAEAEEAEESEAEDAEEEDAEAAEEEDADEAEEAAEEAEAEDEIEVSEVKIKGKTYFTTNPQNGIIYACVNDDVGDEVGVFKNGIALFTSKK
jgi:flagellar biosynthesis GTPase FlhF